jgi:hypothetical protein
MMAHRLRRSFIAACALTLVVGAQAGDKYLVHDVAYVEPSPPNADETLIYVFREKTSFAGMQKIAIIDNDTVLGVLTPGTFTYFKVPSGQHEIVGYISPMPMVHYRVMPSPGKTVYLMIKVGYTSGLFMLPVEDAEAKPMIAAFKQTDIGLKDQKAKMNYKEYYDKLFQ